MKEQRHNILISGQASGGAYLDRLAAAAVSGQAAAGRMGQEALRCRSLLDRAAAPDESGAEIIPAPARGGFVLERIRHMEGMTRDDFVETPRGYVRRSPIRVGDAFDAMIAAAARRKQPWPLTPGQIAIGRRYRALVEFLSADGTKLSQLQGSFGSGDGGDWMDQRLALSRELEGMRRRIGMEPAMVLRRVRPSQRGRSLAEGERAPHIFTSRDLVDAVCLRDLSIKSVLSMFGWSDSGRNCRAAREALSEALDAMIGYRPEKSS